MKKLFPTLMAALALLVSCVDNNPPQPDPPKIDDPFLYVTTRTKSVAEVGNEIDWAVETNVPDVVCECSDSVRLELVSKSEEDIIYKVKRLNLGPEGTLTFSFTSKDYPEINTVKTLPFKSAILIDVLFNEDGTATNRYELGAVSTIKGGTLFTYYNEQAQLQVARFTSSLAANLSEGFYKIDYSNINAIKNSLANGYALEAQFMLSGEIDANGEIKIVSSMNSGGMGIMLTSDTHEIAFYQHINGKWQKCTSGIVPEPGKYYDVIGSWDSSQGKTKIFVNGELKRTISEFGGFDLPSSVSQRWLCIGGDPASATGAESSWRGDVVIARLYDFPVGDEDAALQWTKADKPFLPGDDLSGLAYIPLCTVSKGAKYTIAGNCFKQDDLIALKGAAGDTLRCATTIDGTRAEITLPLTLSSGKYTILIVRESRALPIGMVEFTLSDSAPAMKRPMIVAHRGYHLNSPENSIEALKKAQEAGFDAVETDCWITTDGEIYIHHDGNPSGVVIQNSTSAQIAKLKLANGENVPTMREFLTQAAKCKSTKIVIEFKEHSSQQRNFACVDKVLETVNDLQMGDCVQYISFNRDICKRIAAAKTGCIVGYLSAADINGLYADGIMCGDFPIENVLARTQYISEAHAKGMIINVWTVNSDYDMTKAIGLGVDAITTDYPNRLKDICTKIFGE